MPLSIKDALSRLERVKAAAKVEEGAEGLRGLLRAYLESDLQVIEDALGQAASVEEEMSRQLALKQERIDLDAKEIHRLVTVSNQRSLRVEQLERSVRAQGAEIEQQRKSLDLATDANCNQSKLIRQAHKLLPGYWIDSNTWEWKPDTDDKRKGLVDTTIVELEVKVEDLQHDVKTLRKARDEYESRWQHCSKSLLEMEREKLKEQNRAEDYIGKYHRAQQEIQQLRGNGNQALLDERRKLEKWVEQRDDAIKDLRNCIKSQDQVIRDRNATIDQKDREIGALCCTVSNRERDVKDRDIIIADNRSKLRQYEEEMDSLNRRNRELSAKFNETSDSLSKAKSFLRHLAHEIDCGAGGTVTYAAKVTIDNVKTWLTTAK